MSQMQLFNNPVFGELPVIVVDGEELFGAVEAALALTFSDPHKAVKNYVDEDDWTSCPVTDSLGRTQQKKFINESGLYSLIFGAANQGKNLAIKKKAKDFKNWVTKVVLPSIRKHGMYATDELLNDPDLLIQVATQLKTERAERQRLEAEVKEAQPMIIFANAVTASDTSILIGELAKIIKQNGYDIGGTRLFQWMRDNGYLIRRKGTDYNMPTQRAMELELFEIKETAITHSDGHVSVSKTTKVTGKGQVYFINKFNDLKVAN